MKSFLPIETPMRDPREKIQYDDKKRVAQAKMWNKKFKFIFIVGVVLLTLMPVSYAYSYSSDVATREIVQVEVAEPSVAPSWIPFGGAIGGVTNPGDLFYIDATDNPAELQVTLYLTNTQQLIRGYRYLTLKVGVYVEGETNQWQKASRWDGELIPDTYITLLNSQVRFTLLGNAKYKVTIDDGCFYCVRTDADGGSVSPQFYLATE